MIKRARVCHLLRKFEIKVIQRYERLDFPELTSVQNQVLYGMIISDGHINFRRKNPRIKFFSEIVSS